LPQLVSLAEGDSSRARRVACYEGLHSIALWLVGNMAQTSQQCKCGWLYVQDAQFRKRYCFEMLLLEAFCTPSQPFFWVN
jgi:hypothetical protein